MNRRTQVREEMYADLMRTYRNVCQEREFKEQTECYEEVVRQPAPRFYVDLRRAHVILSPMLRGDRSQIDSLPPLKQQMYNDLFEVVMRLSATKKFANRSLHYVLRFAICEPAPRFYISAKRMGQIWLMCRRKNGIMERLTRKNKTISLY